MKRETKTIIMGVVATILVLAVAIFVIYKVTEKKDTKTEDTNRTSSYSESNDKNNNKDSNNIFSNTVKDENKNNATDGKVTLYMFWGDGCPHCEHAKEFYDTIKNNYDYLEIKTYELWKSSSKKENLELMEKVGEALNFDASGIPFIVIGDFKISGFGSTTGDKIKEAIEKAHNNKDYVDIVAKVIEENPNIKAEEEIYK